MEQRIETKPMVRIVWQAAILSESASHNGVLVSPPPTITIGFLVGQTDEYIAVAMEAACDGRYHNIVGIPKATVQDEYVLEARGPYPLETEQ